MRAGGRGMLVVETIGRIRRERHVQGKSIKEIARDLNLSRNTVRKVLRSEATSFAYEREVQPQPKLGPWRERLDGLLAANEAKAARERLTLVRIFEELQGLAAAAWCGDGAGLRAAELRRRRGLSVRLEP